MAKLLKKTKQEYVDYIVNFMHKNHTSLWTLEDTRKKWQSKRKYDVNIEQQLISKTKTFVSVHCSKNDFRFRQMLLEFAAEYLSKYTARGPLAQNDPEIARDELSKNFIAWLNIAEKRRLAAKVKPKPVPVKVPKPKTQRRLRVVDGGAIVQEVTCGDKTVQFKYADLAAYRARGIADFKNAWQK